MDKKQKIITELEKNIDIVGKIVNIENWYESVLTELINYFGEPSNQIEIFKNVLNDYKTELENKSVRQHLLIERDYKVKFREVLKRILHNVQNAPRNSSNPLSNNFSEIINPDEDSVMTQRTTNQFSKSGYYSIKHEVFWSISLALIGGIFSAGFYAGNTKFDKNLIDLSDNNRELKTEIIQLKDSIKLHKNIIEYMRHTSDSALDILGHMPYNEMSLDSLSFKKIQANIENAGAVLSLNTHYHK